MKTISNIELGALDLHDQSIESIQLNLSLKEIYIKVSCYDEDKADYTDLDLVFKGVKSFTINSLSMDDFDSIEINSVNITLSENNLTIIKWNLLLGVGKPSSEIQFSFKECMKL